MIFARSPFQKDFVLVVSRQRRAAAERKVRRELDSVSLFPDLARFKTADERLAYLEGSLRGWHQAQRDARARAWREARARLASLSSSERRGVMRYWASPAVMIPRDPGFLSALVRQVQKGQSAWRRLRILRQFSLVSEGRLPRAVLQSIRAWD